MKNLIPRFSLKALLILVSLLTICLGIVVNYRLERNRKIQLLQSRSDIVDAIWHDLDFQRDWIDRLMGTQVVGVFNIHFGDDYSEDPIVFVPDELLNAAAEFSPLFTFGIANARIGNPTRFPTVSNSIEIINLSCEHTEAWLNGLIAAQPPLEYLWSIQKTPAFSDHHLEKLCQTQFSHTLWLQEVNITGTGFSGLSKHNQDIKVYLLDCPLTEEGMVVLADQGEIISQLWLGFSSKSKNIPDLSLLSGISNSAELTVQLYRGHLTAEVDATLNELKHKNPYFSYEITDE